MNLTRCDNCGKEDEHRSNWYTLRRVTYATSTGEYVISGAEHDWDLCSPKCIEEKTRTFYAPESEGAAPK